MHGLASIRRSDNVTVVQPPHVLFEFKVKVATGVIDMKYSFHFR